MAMTTSSSIKVKAAARLPLSARLAESTALIAVCLRCRITATDIAALAIMRLYLNSGPSRYAHRHRSWGCRC
jgi:hypothetical protein